MIATLTSCWLGFLIGLRHALEPDHLAAVSTLIVEHPRIRRAAFLGTCWGLGHSLSLLAVGGGLLAATSLLTALAGVAMLQLAYSPRARSVLAGGVGVFSVLLGVFWGGPILFRLLPQ